MSEISLSEYRWFCHECNALLSEQQDFDANCEFWKCSECGYINEIDMIAFIDDDLRDKIEESGCGTYNEYMNLDDCPKCGNGKMISTTGNWYECDECGFEAKEDEFGVLYYESFCDDDFEDVGEEQLSVFDAAEIWVSNGKDDGYTFGYSESELEEALRQE